MAWNEPGKGGKDPWGRGNGQGAPDLEQLLKQLKRRLGGFGGGSGGAGGSIGFLIIAVIIVIIWLLSGFYKVDSAEKAAVLRFGKFTHVAPSGLHWHIPYPVESVKTVNVARIRSFPYTANMLTTDENIVNIKLDVQYKVKDVDKYLFSITDPNQTLDEVTKSAIRQTVGLTQMNNILGGEGKKQLAERTSKLLQNILNAYNSGLKVNTVNITNAQPPEQVQDAYTDVIKAHQDKQSAINNAQAYRNKILPVAKGTASQKIAQAKGYAKQVVQQAQGRASRFSQLVTAYHKAPDVTRSRMYLDTMQTVLGNSSKVLLDVEKSNPLLYLPLKQLVESRQSTGGKQGGKSSGNQSASNSKGSGQSGGSSSSSSAGAGTGIDTTPLRGRRRTLR